MNNIQRLVGYLLDPEALNVDHDLPIVCLGQEFSAEPDADREDGLEQDGGEAVEDAQVMGEGDEPQQPLRNQQQQAVETLKLAKNRISNYIAQLRNDEEKADEATRIERSTSWPSAFVSTIESLYYMSYRTEFPLIPRSASGPAPVSVSALLRGHVNDRSGFTSDIGWGCMVRSGQTMLANSLARLHHGSKLLAWFADDPQAPFSIHNFVYYGQVACKKLPGEWFGPSAAARCMSILCSSFADCGLRVYISGDAGDVYEDSFLKVATDEDGVFHPTLLLVGIRLGIEKITPVYHDALKFSLSLPESVGIAGGRPSASHYFFAYQGSNFFYLDPHYPRKVLKYKQDISEYTDEDLASVHTSRVRNIKIDTMDPSMLIGFLIKSRSDWDDWVCRIREFPGRKFIHISKAEPHFGQSKQQEQPQAAAAVSHSSAEADISAGGSVISEDSSGSLPDNSIPDDYVDVCREEDEQVDGTGDRFSASSSDNEGDDDDEEEDMTGVQVLESDCDGSMTMLSSSSVAAPNVEETTAQDGGLKTDECGEGWQSS
ncbi:hypothetical protein BZA70DRAFT_286069 [Myxozyma melibiosi]|uniref:Cysteine protease n=1 Tax=Myxozyma melibiosi TaxID=54550 RepID=A0ABR1EZU6_9ASCO